MEYFSCGENRCCRFEHIDHSPPAPPAPPKLDGNFCCSHNLDKVNANCSCEYKVDVHCNHKEAALFMSSSKTQCIHCVDKPQCVHFDRCHIDRCFFVQPGGSKFFVKESGLYKLDTTLMVALPCGEDFNCYDGRFNIRTYLSVNDCPLPESAQAEYLQHGLKTTLVNQYLAFLEIGQCISVFMASNHPSAQIQALCTCEGEPFIPSAKFIATKL